MSGPRKPADVRFFSKVTAPDDWNACWEWVGSKDRAGYGNFFVRGQRTPDGRRNAITTPAHRWSYEFFVAPIPVGLQIDHLCRNRACVNPWHLEPVTQTVNVRRIPRRATCGKGHEFTPENTCYGRHASGHRYRYCRTCKRDGLRSRRRSARGGRRMIRDEGNLSAIQDEIGLLRPLTPAEIRAAQITVAERALDAADAVLLLGALGIGGGV